MALFLPCHSVVWILFLLLNPSCVHQYVPLHPMEDVPLVEFMYLVFTCMPGGSCHRWLRSLLLCLCDVFQVLINSLVCWVYMSTLGLILFQIVYTSVKGSTDSVIDSFLIHSDWFLFDMSVFRLWHARRLAVVHPQTLCLLSLMVRLPGLVNLSKHIKDPKACYLIGQNTTCEFSG